MSELTVIGLVAYIQIGLLILGYLFSRSIREIRTRIVTIEANNDSLADRFEERLAVHESAARKTPKTRSATPRKVKTVNPAKRRAAIEMAVNGTDVRTIADALDMPRPEVRLLLKLSELENEPGGTQGSGETGHSLPIDGSSPAVGRDTI